MDTGHAAATVRRAFLQRGVVNLELPVTRLVAMRHTFAEYG